MENRGPGVPVVKSRCIDGLGSIKRPTCETIKLSRDIISKSVLWQQAPPQPQASSIAKLDGPVSPDASLPASPLCHQGHHASSYALPWRDKPDVPPTLCLHHNRALSVCFPLSSSSPSPFPPPTLTFYPLLAIGVPHGRRIKRTQSLSSKYLGINHTFPKQKQSIMVS